MKPKTLVAGVLVGATLSTSAFGGHVAHRVSTQSSPDAVARNVEAVLDRLVPLGCFAPGNGDSAGAYKTLWWNDDAQYDYVNGSTSCVGGQYVVLLQWFHSHTMAVQAKSFDLQGHPVLAYYVDGVISVAVAQMATRADAAAVAKVPGLHRI
jgi:hypothetical protein